MQASRFFPIIALLVVACSSGSSGGGTGGHTTASGGQGTTSSSSSTHMNVCVMSGDKGNSIGVGKYCTPGGGECTGGGAGLCTADVGEDEWFCVKVGCQMDADCAEDATCVMQMGSSGCVPNKCLSGGSDAGTD